MKRCCLSSKIYANCLWYYSDLGIESSDNWGYKFGSVDECRKNWKLFGGILPTQIVNKTSTNISDKYFFKSFLESITDTT